MNAEAARLVAELELQPHPEGGYYREVFRSERRVADAHARMRSALTVIYFLLAGDDVSAWHRLGSDETWHFARGVELELSVLDEGGNASSVRLGPAGPYVAAIAAGRPFAARLPGRTGFALVSCCVAPGFEFADFELLDPAELARRYPASAGTIRSYAR